MFRYFSSQIRRFSHAVHITNDQLFNVTSISALNNDVVKHMENHNKNLKAIIDNPIKSHDKFSQRLQESGTTASFPEFEDTIKYIEKKIHLSLADLKQTNSKDFDFFKLLGHTKLANITNILYDQKQNKLPYADTIRTIYDSLEFFDILERTKNKNIGVYYHIINYKYYMTKILNEPLNCIIFPTISNKIGATDFIRLRPVPMFLCGVTPTSVYVDEYLQSPLEFFVHDFNHSRRMSEYFVKSIKNKNKNDVINESKKFLDRILPLIEINKSDPVGVVGIKQLMRMILFEITHEDALYLLPDIIWDACHRDNRYTYVFEKTIEKSDGSLNVINYPIEVEGALAYTKFKLQYKFYDDGTKKYIVLPEYRYAKYIAMATIIMLRKLYPSRNVLSYSYYLERTCKNNNIPTPVHKFKVGSDENEQNIDVTSLKSGLKQNYWKDGHRRVIGEHIGRSGTINTVSIKKEYDENAHKVDEIELEYLYNYFK